MNTYKIRLAAVQDNYADYGDELLLDRELQSLIDDLTRAINMEAGENTYTELYALREYVQLIKESL